MPLRYDLTLYPLIHSKSYFYTIQKYFFDWQAQSSVQFQQRQSKVTPLPSNQSMNLVIVNPHYHLEHHFDLHQSNGLENLRQRLQLNLAQ